MSLAAFVHLRRFCSRTPISSNYPISEFDQLQVDDLQLQEEIRHPERHEKLSASETGCLRMDPEHERPFNVNSTFQPRKSEEAFTIIYIYIYIDQ